MEDPGYCGIGKLESGKRDPWWKIACRPHDLSHDELKAGLLKGSYMKVFGKFALNIAKGMAQGAFLVASGPFYLAFGGIGGLLLAGREERAINREKPFLGSTDNNTSSEDPRDEP